MEPSPSREAANCANFTPFYFIYERRFCNYNGVYVRTIHIHLKQTT
jgi:hypothetical protein